MAALHAPIDIDILSEGDGEHVDISDARVLVNAAQLEKLAELITLHVDLDVVERDNNDAEGAQFVRDFLAAYAAALKV